MLKNTHFYLISLLIVCLCKCFSHYQAPSLMKTASGAWDYSMLDLCVLSEVSKIIIWKLTVQWSGIKVVWHNLRFPAVNNVSPPSYTSHKRPDEAEKDSNLSGWGFRRATYWRKVTHKGSGLSRTLSNRQLPAPWQLQDGGAEQTMTNFMRYPPNRANFGLGYLNKACPIDIFQWNVFAVDQ